MEIGIGIPNSVRGTTGPQLLEWARRAEAAGFSTLASIGRVAYPSYEELTVFAQNLEGLEPDSFGPGREVDLTWNPHHTFVVAKEQSE